MWASEEEYLIMQVTLKSIKILKRWMRRCVRCLWRCQHGDGRCRFSPGKHDLNKKTRLQYAGTRQAFITKGVGPYLRGCGFSVWAPPPLWWGTTYDKGRRPTVALPSPVRLHRRSVSLPRIRSDLRGYTHFPSPLPARSERFW